MTTTAKYRVFANVGDQHFPAESNHLTLVGAARAYQKRSTGNLRRIYDAKCRDVTQIALDALYDAQDRKLRSR